MNPLLVKTVRFTLITTGVVIYALLAWVASIEVRQVTFDSNFQMALFVVRHVILFSGLAPLLVFVAWCLRVTTTKMLVQGFLIVMGVVLFHFFVAVVSGHSDSAYVSVQLVELVIAWLSLWYLKWSMHKATKGQSK